LIKYALVGAFLVMLALKLAGTITLSWWLVVMPLLVPFILLLALGTIVGTVGTVAAVWSKRKRK